MNEKLDHFVLAGASDEVRANAARKPLRAGER
jgi:hypothetical protein